MKSFFSPESIAVVGATGNKAKGGYNIFNNLATYYGGRVYPVNPNYTEIDGHRVYPSLSSIPEVVELVIIFTPAIAIVDIVKECSRLGIKRIQIQAAGFSEVGEEGRKRTEELIEIAEGNGMRIWGPNCTGSVSARNMFFSPFMPTRELDKILKSGPVSIIAQSGMMAGGFLVQVLDGAYFGIDKVAAIGNKLDVDEVDILEYLADEDDTKVILMYLEGIRRGDRFLEVAKKLRGKKALVLLKGGRTPESAEAAKSHTASLAGDHNIVAGALSQAGVIEARDFIELMTIGQALSVLPTWNGGERVAIVTVTGGGGIVASDLLADKGLSLAQLEEDTVSKLKGIFPPWMPPKNPVDIWPTMELRGINEALESVVPIVLRDPNVDMLLMLPFASPFINNMKLELLTKVMEEVKKPIVSWMFGWSTYFDDFKERMTKSGIPVSTELSHTANILNALRILNR